MANKHLDLASLSENEQHFVACLTAGLTPGEAAREAKIKDTPRVMLEHTRIRNFLSHVRDNISMALEFGK